MLPCGCLAGVYETYSKGVVANIDACGPGCTSPTHKLHQFIELAETTAPRDEIKTSHVGM